MTPRAAISGGVVVLAALTLGAVACAPSSARAWPTPAAPPSLSTTPAPSPTAQGGLAPDHTPCGGAPMTVRFYDAGQGLAALVTLPDGRTILVDTGESPSRPGCGPACAAWHEHVMARLHQDLGKGALDLLWITHAHSDHVGGAADVLRAFPVKTYVDGGRDLEAAAVSAARRAASERGVAVVVVDGPHEPALLDDRDDVKVRAVVPRTWPASCTGSTRGADPSIGRGRRATGNANNCSLGLRIDYCRSSVLFTGDAEAAEEAALDTGGSVTLLQVAHHGSETSSTPAFLEKARPRYAVVTSARPGEGTNGHFCHPRKAAVERLNAWIGGPAGPPVEAFGDGRCGGDPGGWTKVPASGQLWFTARDGDVELTTVGDGTFQRHDGDGKR